jgi:multidrug transporter EmrE-like cation transporter
MLRTILSILLAVICNVLAQVSMKKAAQADLFHNGLTMRTAAVLLTNGNVWLGLIFYCVSFVLSIKIYEKYDLSVISPVMMALIFIFLLIISKFILHESHSMKKIMGMVIILAGIYIVMRSQ